MIVTLKVSDRCWRALCARAAEEGMGPEPLAARLLEEQLFWSGISEEEEERLWAEANARLAHEREARRSERAA